MSGDNRHVPNLPNSSKHVEPEGKHSSQLSVCKEKKWTDTEAKYRAKEWGQLTSLGTQNLRRLFVARGTEAQQTAKTGGFNSLSL